MVSPAACLLRRRDVDPGQQPLHNGPAVHHPDARFSRGGQQALRRGLADKVVVAEAEEEIHLAGGERRQVEVVRSHAEPTFRISRRAFKRSRPSSVPPVARVGSISGGSWISTPSK